MKNTSTCAALLLSLSQGKEEEEMNEREEKAHLQHHQCNLAMDGEVELCGDKILRRIEKHRGGLGFGEKGRREEEEEEGDDGKGVRGKHRVELAGSGGKGE